MKRKISIVIEDLRTRAEILDKKTIFVSPKLITDGQLMLEAANRLQAIEILERELEIANKQIEELKSTNSCS